MIGLLPKITRALVTMAIVSIASFAVLGCASSSMMPISNPPENSPLTSDYAISLHRATVAFERLQPVFHGAAKVRILPDSRLLAYSWRDGRIYLTTGLVRILDDDEVCSVIAHEMGHLTQDKTRSTKWPFALGGQGGMEEEEDADAIGVTLLRRAGVSEGALARSLSKVRDGVETPAVLRQRLNTRIELLTRQNPVQ